MLDLGLVAEEVAAVEPLLTTTNDKGQVEGVKYDRVGVVAINAIKEQQDQLEAQQKEIASLKATINVLQGEIPPLKATINVLQAALCETNPQLSVCKGEPK